MPPFANTKKQFVTNVAKWVACRKCAGANKAIRKPPKIVNSVQDDATDEYQLLNITSPPLNVSVDIEGITVLIQLDTGASLTLMSENYGQTGAFLLQK